MDMHEKAAGFIELSRKKKSLEEQLGEIENSISALEKELYWSFMSEKLDEIKSAGYILRPVLKITATAKDDKTIRVLRVKGFKDLIKPVVHPSTASAFIRKQYEENGGKLPAWIIVNFNIVTRETISMRKE